MLSLCDGHTLATSGAAGHGTPLALASGDFDGDGVPDLVSGFGVGKAGMLTVHRGNVNALWPYGNALRNGPPPAFLPNARTISLPEAPDFVVTGDFDADGHRDIVTAARGSSGFYFLRGDGHGGFAAPKRIAVAGSITTMIAGEINRRDGLTDIVIGSSTGQGAQVLIYESPRGAVATEPEIVKVGQPVTALALGRFDGGTLFDLAVGSGDALVMVHGRDRKLAMAAEVHSAVAPAKVTVQQLPFVIQALTPGDFTGAGPAVAALGADGRVHILEHAIANTTLLGKALEDPNFKSTMQLGKSKPGADGKPLVLGGMPAPSVAARTDALRQSIAEHGESEWTERSAISLPSGFAQATPRLVAGHVSGSRQEDLLIPDSGNGQLHVLSAPRVKLPGAISALARANATAAPQPMKLMASLEAASAPVAVLPMRLNQHGLSGLVVLQAGQSSPTVMPQDVPPANVFTVTNTSDAVISVGTSYTGPDGSLRKALYDASQATGTSSIIFNIPTTDPGYNSATGTFLIQPLSESTPGAFNDFALDPINATVTIDGYTQPGASPNTLANGDNAKILIQIDGGKATTPGGAGLVPFDDVGSTYRGLDFTGWTLGEISNNTESGAEGIEANGVADFIEGNFFGTDPTGKVAAPNRIGVFADNGPGLGNPDPGNTIGGTTPQARNILSGNTLAGVLFLSTAIEGQLQGNFVGLDISGSTILPNGSDGAGLNGPTVTIGGTLPGDGNVISGNPTNVDINDITEGNAAQDSQVQGNLIGTDATGAKSPSGGKDIGVSIVAGPQYMLIGGTTPAARNIISGNNDGVYVFDGAFNNTVQGNYIGTDVTGSKAVGNASYGFVTGVDSDPAVSLGDLIAAGDTTLGGPVAGAGNLISGNGMDGVAIQGASNGPTGQDPLLGNTIQGNFIGTDATGKTSIPNLGNGVSLTSGSANNTVGGTNPGSGNLIANNKGDGVLIDTGVNDGSSGYNNQTIANTILSNTGTGVRVKTGINNKISQNSIFGNGALGIDTDAAGENTNSNCNTDNSGANNLQNSPVLTAGTGTTLISATATDPNGNTSEFSQTAAASISGNMLSLLGNFNSKANTTYTIEFFSNTAADPSGYGQGQTYLSSASITTGADCTVAINNPVNTADADVSVKLTEGLSELQLGPDFGDQVYTGAVVNNGPATAHNVVLTDVLPSGLVVSSAYCNLASCQSTVNTTFGSCTVNGQTVTCNLGTLAPGATASVNIPVQTLSTGSITNTVTVKATEADPVLANNTSSTTTASVYPDPFMDHLDPASVVAGSGDLLLNVYGEQFLPNSTVTFNGTPVAIKAVLNNQSCGFFDPQFCTDLQVLVPAALLTTAGTPTVEVTNPDPGEGGEANFPADGTFTIVASCAYSSFGFFGNIENDGTSIIPTTIEIDTNAPQCPWTATSSVPWAHILDSYNEAAQNSEEVPVNVVGAGGTVIGTGDIDISFEPNTGTAARSGNITVGGQTIPFTQDPGATCDVSLSATTAAAAATGGSGSVAVTAIPASCSQFVKSEASWITVAQASQLFVGSATANYSVAANVGPPRTGGIVIAGHVLNVNQAAPSCYYTLDSTATTLPVSGGTGSIAVTASSPSCAWTAKVSDSSEVSITSGATGTGNGTIKYSVPANTEGPKTPTITIGDATGYAVFTITQTSAFACSFTVSPTPVAVSSQGASNYFLVTSSFSFCKWTAVSSDPTTLSINGASTGTGTSAVYYSVAQNTSTSPRTLTIVAGCETFTVNQSGTASSNPAPVITSISPTSVTAGSPQFTLTVNGTGFLATSSVNFNGKAESTTYVSGTQLTAVIPAADIATAATVPVTVTNPTPGGGTSAGVNFTISPAGSTAPGVSLTPSTLAFSAQTGTTSAPQTATLKNTGNATLTISSVSVGGANPSDFAQTNTCGSSLAAGASCSISISFTPASAASFSAMLSVADNATGSPHTIALTGTGTSAAAPAVSLTPSALTFSAQTGTTSGPQAATLKNTGDATLTISSISVGGTNPSDFAQTNTCGSSLAAGASCSISITFTPASVASFSAIISVTDNATGSPQVVALSGTGTSIPAPAASLTPPSLAFTAQTGTTSAMQAVTLKNTGDAALTISSVSLGGTNPGDFAQSNTCSSSLAAGASCSISVTFTPASAASFSAILSIADNATGSPQTVTLTGTGTAPPAPIASITPSSLTFTAQTGATAAAQTATLKNTGNASLTISAVALGGTDASDFAQTNTCGSSLAAGASCSISVTFTPASAASFSATLSIADNAAASPQTVTLSGTGAAPPPPTYTVTSSTTAQTVQPGGTAQYTITATAENGSFPNAVSLAASGLPSGATATFNPASITPGGSSATSALSIQTAAPVTTTAGSASGWLFAVAGVPMLGLLFAAKRGRRWVTLVLLLLASLGAATAMTGCGGGFALPGSSAKSYTIIVTGTSGAIQQSTTVQLTVQ